MPLFRRRSLDPTPTHCTQCGASLVFRTVRHERISFDPANGAKIDRSSEELLMVCSSIPEDAELQGAGHDYFSESSLDPRYELPEKMLLFNDRAYGRRTSEALARRRAAGDGV